MWKKMAFIFAALVCFKTNAYANHPTIEGYMKNACYRVYQNDVELKQFISYNQALEYAKLWENATLVYDGVVWHNFADEKKVGYTEIKGNTLLKLPPLEVYQLETMLKTQTDFNMACEYAKKYANSFVCGEIVLWNNYAPYYYWQGTKRFACDSVMQYIAVKKGNAVTSPLYRACDDSVAYSLTENCNHRINGVKCIAQNPQLPRGCEVTSLAMLLNYNGISVSKMTLAEQLEKVNYKEDPNKGFIGDMYSLKNFGLGVYHSPVARLAEKYVPDRVEDMTGCSFNDLNYYITQNKPVWVINNTAFNALDESYFTYWNTPSGKIKITYKEHSVLITGIDSKNVYINDPLTGGARTLNKANFIKGWEQMGRQAVVVN